MEPTKTPLKLSDYMRAGIATTRPGKNEMLSDDKVNGRLYACAVGAACYAKDPAVSLAHLLYSHATLPQTAKELFPELTEMVSYHFVPDDGPSVLRLGSLIVSLNDTYGLERTQIADVVEGLGY